MPAEIVDADSHVYEPAAVWDFVPDGERAAATRAFHHSVNADGTATVTLNGAPAKSMNRSHINRQAIWRPGMTPESIGALDPTVAHPINPGASDASARLADMDAMGVAQAVVYPTLFLEYLPQVADADAAAVLARAYNDWAASELAAKGNGRLHPVAVLPLQHPDLAVAELDRVAANGFRSALIRPAFYKIKSELAFSLFGSGADPNVERPVFIEDKPYRAVWEKAAELGIVTAVHPSANITGADAVSSGGFAERVSERLGVQHTITEPIAYMQDADLFVTAALFHGLFEDLPSLKVAIAHAGTTWVPLALEKCETYLWLGGMGSAVVSLEPEEVWERSSIVTTFDSWERPVARMPERIGSKAAWGSRYPHHDAAGPDEAVAMLQRYDVAPATVDRLMGGTVADLFGLAVAV